MKIVLLPGMDGTGKLFEPVCEFLPPESTIMFPLPQIGSQAYEYLAEHVAEKLPGEDFIIVAESFSGPIAALLAEKSLEYLKGIVFVATFLQCPKPALVSLAKLLPLKSLLSVRLSQALVSRYLLDGFSYSAFDAALGAVTNSILKERLSSIQNLNMEEFHSSLPIVYINAKSDILVSARQIKLFQRRFQRLQVEHIQGTHFLLQTNPEACGEIIRRFSGF